jgi:putative ABC transport system permease protein
VAVATTGKGYWYGHDFYGLKTGAPELHPWWKLNGSWPVFNPNQDKCKWQVVLGKNLASRLKARIGDEVFVEDGCPEFVTGILTTGDQTTESFAFFPLEDANELREETSTAKPMMPGVLYLPPAQPEPYIAIDRVDISARTKPEDAFARRDPDTMSGPTREIWYCRPYANSIAYQIREAIPGAQAEQVRRVEQTEGTVLERISGLMWLVSGAALLAAGFAVSAAMATAVLERRREIGLMRSLGASKAAIATLFYAESGLLAIVAGTIGYLAGSLLAFWLGARIFPGDGAAPLLNFVLLPVVVAMALIVAVAGATPSIRKALNMDPSAVLRVDA